MHKGTRSSEGKTPRPDNKTTKMASNLQTVSITESIKDIKEDQDGLIDCVGV